MDELTVLVFDAGSSSLHLNLVDARGTMLETRDLPDADDTAGVRQGLTDLLRHTTPPDAVGHRIVHGGSHVRQATVIDRDVRNLLEGVASLAPLHVPPALRAVDLARAALPDIPHVACVDTAFHALLPEVATTYALPAEWRTRFGLRRYGFHGLSYAWALARTAELLGNPVDELKLLLAHLGGGASVCAVRGGRSVDTSMGFTPLEGLVMARRSGSVDPGLILWLLQEQGLTVDEVADGLQHRSGLLALSAGRTQDTRDLVELASAGDPEATLALDVFAHRAARELAAASASLDRVDAVVFTGEIGADQPEVRESICSALGPLGVSGTDLAPVIDADAIISPAGAEIPVVVINTGEIQQIANEVRRILASTTP